MRGFSFTRVGDAPPHVLMYSPGSELIIEKNNLKALTTDWSELDLDETPFTRYVVNNNNMEEVAIYLALARDLLAGLAVYAIPNWHGRQAAKLLDKRCQVVSWEYGVDSEASAPEDRIKGFVRGRSGQPLEGISEGEIASQDVEAALFRIDGFADMAMALRAVIGDATAEITFFGLSDENSVGDLLERLRAPARPTLHSVLNAAEIMVDISIGVDLGYYDSILVASNRDVEPHLDRICERLEARAARYEDRVDAHPTVPELVAELAWLTAE